MPKVIIDTSSILFGIKLKKDVFEVARLAIPGCELIISKGIVGELNGINMGGGRRREEAGIALRLLKKHKIHINKSEEYPDSWIYKAAVKYKNSIVITNDTALLKKIGSAGGMARRLSVGGSLK
ncbi:MAG: hypothetical protein M1528_02145 [Candidatus Marsarchaeota archaeon]|nr:hypothetical protein [Candidatus Marsarchaeota archaeon]MCL5115310.1 hypothetical protein [Candidatus Marsarchaeota archaeon]